MKKKLSDIASIRTGYYTKPFSSGEVYYIQASDVLSGRISSITPTVLWDSSAEKHFLQSGDVLLPSKGNNNTVFLYRGEIRPAVASSIFMVIRVIDADNVLPTYLQWFLNLSSVQDILGRMSKGTRINSLSKKSLGDLPVDIPDMSTQKKISKLHELESTRKNITAELNSLKELELQTRLMNLVQEKS